MLRCAGAATAAFRMPPILVTGSSGFLGRVLATELERRGLAWRGARPGPLGPDTDWLPALPGVEVVIHLAGIAHAPDADETAMHRANALGTRRLAEQAAAAGVRRLVFASSVKAMGESTPPGAAWTEADPARPRDAYGRSKLAAEEALRAVAADTGLQVVSLRMPLIYGPGVRANLRRLLDAVAARRPLPFGAVRNRRSLIGASNAADALLFAAATPPAASRVWLVRDADYSTPELVRTMARALGVAPRLWSVPPPLLALLPARRLTASLAVDDRALRALGWNPPCAPDEEWARAAAAHRPASPPRLRA